MSNENISQANDLSTEKMYEVVNPKTGVIKEYPLCMQPRKSTRLNKDGGEIFNPGLLVNPLHKQPSIKSMVQAALKSGRLLELHNQAQNLQLAEANDPEFQGYDRNWLEENFLTTYEANYLRENIEREIAVLEASEPSQPEPATPVAPASPEAPPQPPQAVS